MRFTRLSGDTIAILIVLVIGAPFLLAQGLIPGHAGHKMMQATAQADNALGDQFVNILSVNAEGGLAIGVVSFDKTVGQGTIQCILTDAITTQAAEMKDKVAEIGSMVLIGLVVSGDVRVSCKGNKVKTIADVGFGPVSSRLIVVKMH